MVICLIVSHIIRLFETNHQGCQIKYNKICKAALMPDLQSSAVPKTQDPPELTHF